MAKKSPRYPRQTLAKSLEMVRKIFKGVHQAQVDADVAAQLIGYTNSRGGAAAGALGALRQFGLLDGLRGAVSVSDLAMRIIQPMDEQERVAAMREAAAKPEIFGKIISQFDGRIPSADAPIGAFLIRQEGFSASGASELIKNLRETLSEVPEAESIETQGVRESSERQSKSEVQDDEGTPADERLAPLRSSEPLVGELITLPLGQNAKAELRLVGEITATSYARLIRHLELLRDMRMAADRPDIGTRRGDLQRLRKAAR